MEAMQRRGLWADFVFYSELVKCCLARRAVQQGKLVHKHVFSNGYQPKTFLINVFINIYVKFALLEEEQELFDEMLEGNVVSWTTMISGYSNSKLNHKALESLVLEAKFDAFRPKFERPFCCFCIEMVELENAQKPL
ncbi:hypothetical protein ACFX2I_046140 [Malus domestica]